MKKPTKNLLDATRPGATPAVTLPDLHFSRYSPRSKADDLLRAALVVFLQYGGNGATPELIGTVAESSANTLYRLFGTKAGCFDILFDECWYELNQALKNKDFVPDFSRTTPEDILLADVEFILSIYADRLDPLRDIVAYVMMTISRPIHLSDPHYASDSQGDFEDRLFALCAAVNKQYALTTRDAETVGNHVFTYMRTAVALWATPQGERLLEKSRVIAEVSAYLRGDEGGPGGGISAGDGDDESGDGHTGVVRQFVRA